MELMTEFHSYPGNAKRIKNIKGKGCIPEVVSVYKPQGFAMVELVCNRRGNAKKAIYYENYNKSKHGRMDGAYEIRNVYIPVEKGDYIISYTVDSEEDSLAVFEILDVQVKGEYNSYAVTKAVYGTRFNKKEKIDLNSIKTYERLSELAKVALLAHKKAYDYIYELKPYCRMG